MFADHQPRISAFARRSPENLRRVIVFALCTIRMPLYDAAKDTPLAIRGEPCHSIFGAKHDGLAWIRDHAPALHHELEYLYETGATENALLRAVLRVPCIGLAKGGFILQMAYGMSGCLDSHNLARFGIGPRVFATGHAYTDRRRVPDYNAMIRRLGGTAYLWDSWCTYVAQRGTAGTFDANAISRLHLAPCEAQN